uniref:EGF-like domain-containing protein n=1 Tax=Acrobeloides nanus TaxID=290746 RepID=A0A914C187_9BILA
MIMRHRLFAFLILCFDIGYALLVQQNQPCNKDRDILLSEDPSGNPQSFLRCTGVGVGTIGFWERRFCPHDMTFDFIKQQCRSPQQQQIQNNNMLGEEQEVKNIAILNGTCAHGEQCIGGTVCDLETLRCLCPYGTIANLETLSCHQLSSGLHNSYEKEIPSAKIVPSPNSGATPSYFKPLGPIIGELKNLAQSVSSSMNFNTFTQPPSVPTFSSYGGSNNNYNNYNNHNNNNMGGSGGSGFNINPQIASKPSVFLPEAQPIHPINSLVPPGGSCALGEHCGGGSVCTKPMNLCLCPGELEDHGGRCIVPPRNELPQPIMKVGIGAMCNRYAACDHDSTCINGRCQCVEPLIEHNGKCVLKLMPKEVGPGELCDNGEVCIKGSICDPTIPVCVCPSGTDLENGECVEVKPTSSYETIPTQPVFRPDPQTIAQEIYGNSNYNNYGAPPTPPVRGAQVITYAPQPQPAPTQAPPVAYTSAPERSPKPNVMKMNLGGTKQAGVGVRCSLNTDCMIGAYCNGNTQPPTCQCLSTHVNVNGRCEKVIYPGQVGCEHDQQCMAAYTGTSCIDRQCVCPAGSKAIEQTCVSEFAYPGDLCNLSKVNSLTYPACSGNSFCSNSRCTCEPELIIFQRQCVNKSDLYLAPNMEINCHRDSDCLPDFLCIENFCECPPNKVRLNAQCIELTNVEARRKKVESEKGDAMYGFVKSNPTMEHLWMTISSAIKNTREGREVVSTSTNKNLKEDEELLASQANKNLRRDKNKATMKINISREDMSYPLLGVQSDGIRSKKSRENQERGVVATSAASKNSREKGVVATSAENKNSRDTDDATSAPIGNSREELFNLPSFKNKKTNMSKLSQQPRSLTLQESQLEIPSSETNAMNPLDQLLFTIDQTEIKPRDGGMMPQKGRNEELQANAPAEEFYEERKERLRQKRQSEYDSSEAHQIGIFIPDNFLKEDHILVFPKPLSTNQRSEEEDPNLEIPDMGPERIPAQFERLLNSIHRPVDAPDTSKPQKASDWPIHAMNHPMGFNRKNQEKAILKKLGASHELQPSLKLELTKTLPDYPYPTTYLAQDIDENQTEDVSPKLHSPPKLKWTLVKPVMPSHPDPFKHLENLLRGISPSLPPVNPTHPLQKRLKRSTSDCWPDQTTCANGLGICIGEICQCMHNFVYKHGKCIPEILELESFCDSDVKSPICPVGAICRDGVCQCKNPGKCGIKEEKRSALESSSVAVKNYGEGCREGDICMNGTVCANDVCACPNGFTFQDGTCIKSSGSFKPINSQCQEHDRCSGGSICTNFICSCIDGSVESQGRCRQRPGGRCSYGQTCAGGSVCELGICQCPAGKRMFNHTCVTALAKPGQSCQSGEKCTDGSLCRFGVCMCTADYHVVDHKCEKITSKKTFSMKTIGKNGNTPEVIMIPPARAGVQAKPGHLCLDGEECIGGSKCKEGYCVCSEQQIVIDDKCITTDAEALQIISEITKAAPGQHCTEKITCTGNSVCLANICVCPDGTFLIRGACQENVSNAIFLHELKESPGTSPQPGLIPGSMCKVSIECPYRTDCIRGVCRCKQTETIVNGMCRKAIYEVSPGGRCDPKKGLDCIGESHCYYGICVCLYGLINIGTECASPDVLAEVPPGAPCDRGQTCQGGSTCISGVCRCGQGEVIDVNKKCAKKTSTVAFYMYPGNSTTLPSSIYQPMSKLGAGGKPMNVSNHPGYKESLYPVLGYPPDNGKFNQIVTANQMTVNLVDPQTLRAILSKQLDKLPILGEPCDDKCGGGAKCFGGVCRCETGYVATSDGKCLLVQNGDTGSNVVSNTNYGGELYPEGTSTMETPYGGYPGSTKATSASNGGYQPYVPTSTPATRTSYSGYPGVAPATFAPYSGYQPYVATPAPNFQGIVPNRGFATNSYPRPHPAFRVYQTTTPAPKQGYGCQECASSNQNGNFPYKTNFLGSNGAATMPMNPNGNGPFCSFCSKTNFPGRIFSLGQNNIQIGRVSNANLNNGKMPSSVQSSGRNGGSNMNILYPTLRPSNSEVIPTTMPYDGCSKNGMCSYPQNNPNAGLPGNPCTQDNMCYNGATCIRNLCICKPGYKPTDGTCQISKVQLGQMCLIDEQCQSNSYCYNGICKCPDDVEIIQEDGSRSCTETATSHPGEDCSQKQACSYNSACGPLSGVCECPMGMETREGECHLATRQRGNQCYSSGFCDRSAYCDNGYCVCKDGVTSRFCQPVGGKTDGSGQVSQVFQPAHPASTNFMNTREQEKISNMGGYHKLGGGEQQIDLLENTEPLRTTNGKDPFRIFVPGTNSPMPTRANPNLENGFDPLGGHYGPMGSTGQTYGGHHGSVGTNGQTYGGHYGSVGSTGQAYITPSGNLGSGQTLWPFDGNLYSTNFNQFHPMARGVKNLPEDPSTQHRPPINSGGTSTSDDDVPPISVAMPGEHCGTGRICLGNSHCSSNYCQCPEGTKIHNGICSYADGIPKSQIPKIRQPKSTNPRAFANPLESCEGDIPCTEGSSCSHINLLGPICLCKEGTTFFINTCILERQNVEVVKIGQACTMLQICANGAFCKDGKCACPRGKQPVAGHCVKISLPGESCDEGEICSVSSVCDPEAMTCVCPIGKQIRNGICEDENEYEAVNTRYRHNRWKNSRNLTDILFNLATISQKKTAHHLPEISALPGQFCNEETQCSYESYCSALGYCTCLPGSVIMYERCIDANKIRLPGEGCYEGEDVCIKNSWCNGGKCACLDGKEPVELECSPWKPQDGSTGAPERLKTMDGSKIGMDQKMKEARPQAMGYKILEVDDSQEIVEKVEQTLVQKEPPGPLQVKIKIKKLKQETPEKTNCTSSSQCPYRSTCKNSKCYCDFGEVQLDSTTQETYKNVSSWHCNLDEDCHSKSLRCVDGKCACHVEPETSLSFFDDQDFGSTNDIPPELLYTTIQNHTTPKIGSISCQTDQDCSINETTCSKGFCNCNENMSLIISSNGSASCVANQEKSFLIEKDAGVVEENGTCQYSYQYPTMIVMRGICVQTQPRPTVPPQTTKTPPQHVPQGAYNSLQNLRPVNQGYETMTTRPSGGSGAMLPAPRKAAPGTNCGPLDICVGGSSCVDNYCICPSGHTASVDTGRCEPNQEPQSRPAQEPRTEVRTDQDKKNAPRYSRPNEPCSNGEICTGGSECREKQTCVCPVDRPIIREHNCIASDEKPMIRHVAGPGEECNKETRCTDRSVCYQGICRCQSGYIAISGKCIQLPTTQQTELPTTRLAIIVGPGENCGQDRSCGGGSSCENGVCTCPMGSMNMGGQCQKLVSTERAETTSATVAPFGKSHRRLAGIEHTCNDDTQCGANAICIVGKCKCRTGYKEANGVCTIMEDVAVAHNRTYSSISNSQQIHKSEAASKSGSNVKSTSNPNYAETETSSAPKPRIVGPPIRKPKPKTPSGPTPLVTGGGRTNGVGVCPPGNEPLRDESSGDLVLCNGLTPNCPPKSYCYVTGVASEEYNCCKSW